MMDEVIKYLKDKGIEIDDKLLGYIEGGVEISEKDEYKHDFGTFPEHHNESWYFNFIDRKNNVFLFTRLSMEMFEKDMRSIVMLCLIIDGEPNVYFNQIPLENMPDNWEYDKKVKYYCIEPMKKWRITYQDKRFELDILFEGRFHVYNYLSHKDPLKSIKELGVELLERTAQHHYEQAMRATGTIILKKQGETLKINCLGHRDHSWGTRDWVKIDRWYWISAQFEDETLNIFQIEFAGKMLLNGFYSNNQGNTTIESVEISTKTKSDGKTPISSVFKFIDEHGKKRTIESKTIHNIYLPLPSSEGFTEIYEQIATFEIEGKKGAGVAEYLISTRK